MTHFIKGNIKLLEIKEKLKNKTNTYISEGYRKPCLAIICVGNNLSSKLYINNKQKACNEIGVNCQIYNFEDTVKENNLIKVINKLNVDSTIDGILIQLPLPQNIQVNKILKCINYKKDVDGLHPYNIGKLSTGYNNFLKPCTPKGIMYLLSDILDNFKGIKATILGSSIIVGKPMAMELLNAGCTVTTCNIFTKNLKSYLSTSDLIISAIGKPHIIKGEWLNIKSIVIDVGINFINNKIVGDIDFNPLKHKVKAITPVPGGVGPATIAALLENTIWVYENNINKLKTL